MILVKRCQDGAGGSNVRISRAGSGFGHKAAGRCLECQVQACSSLWVKSISVTADSVGPAAPGVVQWRNTIRSSSALYSGQAPNRASQGGSCNWVWDQMILVKHCRDGARGSSWKISRVDSGFVHKAAGRCLECQVQTYRSLWVKSGGVLQ